MPSNVQQQLIGSIDEFIPEGRRYYRGGQNDGKPREKQSFSYSAPFNGAFVLNAGTTVSFSIAIDADSDFIAFNVNKRATLTNNVTFIPLLPATILITLTGSGTRIMDAPQHIENYAGSAELPGVPPFPIWIPGSSTVQVQLASLDPVNNYNVWIAFPGVKLF